MKRIVVALGISLLLLVGVVSPVSAGVEPSPFIINFVGNQLRALCNQLNAIDSRLTNVPEPISTVPDNVENWTPLVRILSTTANKLDRIYTRVDALEPPVDNSRVRDSLTNLRDAAQRIVATVDAMPQPNDDRVVKALNEVRIKAEAIEDLSDRYLTPSLVEG